MKINGISSRHISRTVIAVTCLIALCSMTDAFWASARAEEAKQPTAAARPPADNEDEAVTALKRQKALYEEVLEKAKAAFGKDHPRVKQAEQDLKALQAQMESFTVQQRLQSLKSQTLDEADAKKLNVALQTLQQHLQQTQMQLAQREQQLAILNEQLSKTERDRALPPLEEGQIRVFPLKYATAKEASNTVESLFGAQALRVAIDDRTNTLIVFGKQNVIDTIQALLQDLDQQAASKKNDKATKTAEADSESRSSVLLRLFWLADGVPETVGQPPKDFLPSSVLKATEKLGLEAPRLVTQTVTSLSVGSTPVPFSSNVPAIIDGQQLALSSEGNMKLSPAPGSAQVQMSLRVDGTAVNVQGSLETELGHYMVLGTANSVMNDSIAMNPNPFGPGAAGGSQPGRYSPGPAGPEGGLAPGAEGPAAGAEPAKPNFTTSHFAFVVQVTEAESYSDEAAKQPAAENSPQKSSKGEPASAAENPFGR